MIFFGHKATENANLLPLVIWNVEDGSVLPDRQTDRLDTGCQQSRKKSLGRRWPRGTCGGWPWMGCAPPPTVGLAGCSISAAAVNLDK